MFSISASTTFKSRIDTILKRSITRSQDSRPIRLKLDDTILDCLALLPVDCRDEDLEDMFYFMTESFQLTGVPVAYDEIDVDQVRFFFHYSFSYRLMSIARLSTTSELR